PSLDLRQRLSGIQNTIALGLGVGAIQVGLAYGRKESTPLLFKTIQPSPGCSSRQANFNRQVEDQRQVRPPATLNEVFQKGNSVGIQAATAALIGVGGVGKTVTEHHRATL